ncbi:MAG: hypothetical protein AB2745_02230 [Candidatus Thiodiazotropha endolucinida]
MSNDKENEYLSSSVDEDTPPTQATESDDYLLPDQKEKSPNDFGLNIDQPENHDPNEAVPSQDRPWFTDDFDAGRAWDLAWELNNTGGAIGRMMAEGNNFDHDPDFDIRERFDELSEDVPSEHWERLAEARNEAHAFYIKSRIDEEMAQKEELMKMGTGAYIGSTLLQGVTDPGALALSISTGGFAAIAKAKRLSTAIKAGLVTGAENMALETVLSQSNKTSDMSDVLWAGAAGVALGGTFGAVMAKPGTALDEIRPDIQEAAQRHLYDIEDANLREAKGETADDLPDTDLVKEIREADIAAQEAAMWAEIDHEKALQKSMRASLSNEIDPDMPRSVGAAEAEFQNMDAFSVDVPADILNTPKLNAISDTKIDFGLNPQLMRDENPYMRWIGYTMSENAAGFKDHAPGIVSASERAGIVLRRTEADFQRGVFSEYGEWTKVNGKKSAWFHPEVREEFMTKVTDQVEGITADPSLVKTAAAFSRGMASIHKMAAESGVKGFDKFKSRPDYVPRIANPDAWQQAIGDFSTKPIEKLITKGIKSAQPTLDDALVARMARGYTKNVGMRSFGVGARTFDIGGDNRVMLEEMLKEMDLEEADIKNILTTIMGAQGKTDAGNHARAKHRTLMNLDVSVDVVSQTDKTGKRVQLRLADLFERDAERLLGSYARTVGGLASIAQRTQGTSRHITSRADFDKLLDEARRWEATGGRTKGDLDDMTAKAELIWKKTTGIPVIDQTGNFHRGRRLAMNWNFTRMMGKVAFAQFSEFGNMLAYAGFRETMQQIPAFGKFIKRLRTTGKLNLEAAAELEEILGVGTDGLRSMGARSWDDGNRIPGLNRIEESVHIAQQVVAAPMHAITAIQQRMTGMAIQQRLMNMATGARKLTDGDINRLNHLGLPEEMRERVFSQMKKHVTTKDGELVKGAKVKMVNYDKWDDQEASLALQLAIARMSNRIIQVGDVGTTAAWMHTWQGQVLAQFRSFTLAAHSKQLLNGLHHRDFQTTMAFLLTSMFAGLQYSLRTYQSSYGRDDQEEYLDKMLSPSAIARAAFTQNTWSTLLPVVIDTGLEAGSFDPIFSYRSTGLNQFSNPTTNLAHTAGKALTDITGAIRGLDDWDGDDFRNLRRLMPMQNLPGVEQMLNAIGSRL